LPEQQVDPNNPSSTDHTTWSYYADDTMQSMTDARGASATYIYNNGRHLANEIHYSAPSGITPTSNATFDYDAAGNRTSLTDGLGAKTYSYNELSQLMSETRTFNGVGTFTLGYTYNLAGELMSITDPYGAQINYAHDTTGRLTAVTGSGFGGVTQYASNAQYRVGGGLKHLDYGNGFAMTTSFNPRLQAAAFEVSKPGTNVIRKQFQYYDDGQLKYAQDELDPKFDRSYEHDFMGRMVLAKTGAEARGLSEFNANNRPYRENFGHDAFGHLPGRDTLNWTQSFSSGSTYQNNRNVDVNWHYDAQGNLTSEGSTVYDYDAAGRTTQVTMPAADQTTQWYDGDGQVLKQVRYLWNAQTGAYWANPALFKILIRSTVLGGQVVTEVDNGGQKSRTYVYAGGARLAWQSIWWDGFTPTQVVQWEHRDPSGGSFRMTDVPGQNFYFEEAQPAELDPAGANVQLANPYTGPDPPPDPESFAAYPSFSSPAHPDMTYTVDGIRVTLDSFLLHMGFTAKNPMVLLDMARDETAAPMPRPSGPPHLTPFNDLREPYRPFDANFERPIGSPGINNLNELISLVNIPQRPTTGRQTRAGVAQVRCPPAGKELENNPKVREKLKEAFALSKQAGIERGGWIYWNRATRAIMPLIKDPPTRDPLHPELSDSYLKIFLGSPPGAPKGWYIVADFHAHLESGGPDDHDIGLEFQRGVPGIIIDPERTWHYGPNRGVWLGRIPGCP